MGALFEKLRGSTTKAENEATESLSEQIREVEVAFREQVRAASPPTTDWSGCWVQEVYSDHVIATIGETYYSIPYADDVNGDVQFDLEGATEVERTWAEVAKTFKIEKTDDERQIAFGWAYVAEDEHGERVVDHSGEFIEKQDLEDAAYAFALAFRDGDEGHTEPVKAQLVESFVVTPEKLEKMGLAPDALPRGWWTGLYVEDADLWAKVKDGTYPAFSIGGVSHKEADVA